MKERSVVLITVLMTVIVKCFLKDQLKEVLNLWSFLIISDKLISVWKGSKENLVNIAVPNAVPLYSAFCVKSDS